MLRYGEKQNVARLDLNLFDVEEIDRKKEEKKHQTRAKKFRDPNTSASKKGNWLLWIMFATGVLAFLFIAISGKIELDMVNAERSAVALQIDKATRENDRLQSILEAMASPANIEEYAAEKGLVKEQHSQVTYVSVNVEKSIEVAETRNKNIFSAFGKWVKDKLEYFGY